MNNKEGFVCFGWEEFSVEFEPLREALNLPAVALRRPPTSNEGEPCCLSDFMWNRNWIWSSKSL